MREQADFAIVGKAYIAGRIVHVAIGVSGERITSITSPGGVPHSLPKYELGDGYLILPGMVDIHVHMREPGLEYKEDWGSGSRAAIKGGVTFVADMPNNRPPANSCRVLRVKLEKACGKSLVDYAFYAGYTACFEELLNCSELFIGGKLYPEDLFSPHAEEFASFIAKQGKILVIHAEDPSFLSSDPSLPHSLARPPESEISGVKRAIHLSTRAGAKTHVTHVSLAGSIAEILKAKLAGLNISLDTTPHYALLNDSLYSTSRRNMAKVNPPLRSEGDRQAVYNSVKSLLVDAVVTDHAPHLLEEKTGENPPPGFPGLETALHLLLREILEGRMPLQALDLYSCRPARLLGISKGSISVGSDADLVIVRREEWLVKPEEFVSKAKYSPFEGTKLKTRTYAVFLRGKMVYKEGVFMEENRGKFFSARELTRHAEEWQER